MRVVWTMRELVNVIDARRNNKFDCNIVVSGARGDGKSTLLFRMLKMFRGFSPHKHQVYSRDKVTTLLRKQKFGFCFDDEAINSGYKRDFQNKGQQELIKIITAYRSNYNIYASAIPSFYSLDKDLRQLTFLHVHVVERGLAVIFMPLQGYLHSSDPWDTKNNMKLEEKYHEQAKKTQGKKRFPYYKFSTFAGYMYFPDLTEKQRGIYERIKERERQEAFLTEKEKREGKEVSFTENLYNNLMEGKLSADGLLQIAIASNKKYSAIRSGLNVMLKDNGETRPLVYYLKKDNKKGTTTITERDESSYKQIRALVPEC